MEATQRLPPQFDRNALISLLRNGKLREFVDEAIRIEIDFINYFADFGIVSVGEDNTLIFKFIFSNLNLTVQDIESIEEYSRQFDDFRDIAIGSYVFRIHNAIQSCWAAQQLSQSDLKEVSVPENNNTDPKKFFESFKKINANYRPINSFTIEERQNLEKFKDLIAANLGEGLGADIDLYDYLIRRYREFAQKYPSEKDIPVVEFFKFIQNEYFKYKYNYDEIFDSIRPKKSVIKEDEILQRELLYSAYQHNTEVENKLRRERAQFLQNLTQEMSAWKETDELDDEVRKERAEKRLTFDKQTHNQNTASYLESYLPTFIDLIAHKISPEEIPQFLHDLPRDKYTPLFQNQDFINYLLHVTAELRRYSGSTFASEEVYAEEKNTHDALYAKIKRVYRNLVSPLESSYERARNAHLKKLETENNRRFNLAINTPTNEIPKKYIELFGKQHPSINNYFVSLEKQIKDLDDPASDIFYRLERARRHRNALAAFKNSGLPNASRLADYFEAQYAEKAKAANAVNKENAAKLWRFLWTNDPNEPVWRAMFLVPKPSGSKGRDIFNYTVYAIAVVLGGFALLPARALFKTIVEGGALVLQKVFEKGITALTDRYGVNFLTGIGVGVLGIFYAAFKAIRVLSRAATSPKRSAVEGFNTGSVIHRAVGYVLAAGSVITSIGIYVAGFFAAAFAMPSIAAASGGVPVAGDVLSKASFGVLEGLTFIGAKLIAGAQAVASLFGYHLSVAAAFTLGGISVEPSLVIGAAVIGATLPFFRFVADKAIDGIVFAAKGIGTGFKALGKKLFGKAAQAEDIVPPPADDRIAEVIEQSGPQPLTEPSHQYGADTKNMVQFMQESNLLRTGEGGKSSVTQNPHTSSTAHLKEEIQEVHHQSTGSTHTSSFLDNFGVDALHHNGSNQLYANEIKTIQGLLNVSEGVDVRSPAEGHVEGAIIVANGIDLKPLLQLLDQKSIQYNLNSTQTKLFIIFDGNNFKPALDAITLPKPAVTTKFTH